MPRKNDSRSRSNPIQKKVEEVINVILDDFLKSLLDRRDDTTIAGCEASEMECESTAPKEDKSVKVLSLEEFSSLMTPTVQGDSIRLLYRVDGVGDRAILTVRNVGYEPHYVVPLSSGSQRRSFSLLEAEKWLYADLFGALVVRADRSRKAFRASRVTLDISTLLSNPTYLKMHCYTVFDKKGESYEVRLFESRAGRFSFLPGGQVANPDLPPKLLSSWHVSSSSRGYMENLIYSQVHKSD